LTWQRVSRGIGRRRRKEEEEEERTHLSLSCPLVVAVPASSFPLVPACSRSLCPCSSALAHVRPPLLVLSALIRECLPSFIIARPCSSSSAFRVRPPSFVFVRRRSCSPAIGGHYTEPRVAVESMSTPGPLPVHSQGLHIHCTGSPLRLPYFLVVVGWESTGSPMESHVGGLGDYSGSLHSVPIQSHWDSVYLI
jgi:hypothetical protein